MSHYDTLGAAAGATQDELKAAYRRQAAAAHPDRDGGSAERMQAVNAAWACLGDKDRRARYDESGDDSPGHTLEEQAHQLLLDVLSRALEESTDMLAQARHEMKQVKEHASHILMRNTTRVAGLKKRRDSITAKGENLVHGLIDAKLAEAAVQTAAAQHMLKVHEKAAAMLAAYSSTEAKPAPELTADQFFIQNFKPVWFR